MARNNPFNFGLDQDKGHIQEFQFKETVVLWWRYAGAILLNSFVSIHNFLHTFISVLIKTNKQTEKTL